MGDNEGIELNNNIISDSKPMVRAFCSDTVRLLRSIKLPTMTSVTKGNILEKAI
jgi:hypothetical protein